MHAITWVIVVLLVRGDLETSRAMVRQGEISRKAECTSST
jgi:hypothetical protein